MHTHTGILSAVEVAPLMCVLCKGRGYRYRDAEEEGVAARGRGSALGAVEGGLGHDI